MKLTVQGRNRAASRWRNKLAAVLLAVATVFLASAAHLSAAPAVPLHTQGPFIVDSNGYRVRLNAVNWYGAEGQDFVVMGLEAQPLATIVSEIKSRGFNAVRLPWSNQMYETNPVVGDYALTANPSLEGENAMTIFDTVVNALTSAGIMVILDNHTSTAMWCCGNDVNQLWYNSSYPLANWISDWEGMVQRYASNPMVIGVDLRNEPRISAVWGGGGSDDWHAAATTMGNDILAINSNLLVFVEGINYAGDLSGVSSLPVTLNVSNRLVYEVHDYGFWYSGLTGYSDWYGKINPKWGYLVTGSSQAPVWIGEFGTCDTASTCVSSSNNSDLGYWYGFIHLFIWRYSMDWSYWAINGTTETGHGGGFGSAETYGILDTSWSTDALPALTSDLQSLMHSGAGPATGTYEISNDNSGLAMEVNGWSKSNGGIVDQWTWGNNQANQEWTLSYLNNGLYQLTNVNSGLVLDATNKGKTDGTKMQQWSNLSGSNQEYVIRQTPDGYYLLFNSNAGLAVEVPGFSDSNGTQLDLWGFNGGSNQKWTFTSK
ncbi:MAG TPA: cellulase family glycosylhydrolase [Terracidiphilus sp.]|jgi:endoglucanase|nr:cellulase family glycosylhydrolase [Terracidiphilus sp.]